MAPLSINANDKASQQVAAWLSNIAYTDDDGSNTDTKKQHDDIDTYVGTEIPTKPNGQWKLIWGPGVRDGILTYVAQAADGTYAVACRGTIGPGLDDLIAFFENVFDDLASLSTVPWPYPPSTQGSDSGASTTYGDSLALGSALAAIGYNSTQDLKGFLESQLKSNPGPIMVTGHSLGGGLANLLAVYLAYTFPKTQVVPFTFAAPTVSSDVFASSVFAKYIPQSYQCVNSNDVVPMVWWNLWSFINAYTPSGQEPGTALYDYSEVLYYLTIAAYGYITLRSFNYTRVVDPTDEFTNPLDSSLDWAQQTGHQHSLTITYFPHLGLPAKSLPGLPLVRPGKPVAPSKTVVKLKNAKLQISIVQ